MYVVLTFVTIGYDVETGSVKLTGTNNFTRHARRTYNAGIPTPTDRDSHTTTLAKRASDRNGIYSTFVYGGHV